MKKNYFMLAATTMMLAACAQTDVVNEIAVEETPQAIGFETFANKQTRADATAENSGTAYSGDLSNHHTSFEVYAYKNVSETKVFNNETVTYTAANQGTPAKWSYTGQVYWDKAATKYNFYAAAPAADYWKFNEVNTNNKVDQTKSYFSIPSEDNTFYTVTSHNASTSNDYAYKQSFNNTNATDLMIAAPKEVQTSAFGTTVQLDFIHILSRLNITVSKDETLAGQTVVLKSLTLSKVNNQGTFDESKVPTSPATLATGTHERWTTNDVVTTYSSLSEVTLKYVSNETTIPSGATATPEYMLQALIMPQTAGVQTVELDGTSNNNLTEPYFTIVYTITDNGNTESFTASYNLASAFGVQTLAFNEGWQNTLNITIKPTAIEFNSNVAVWADKNNNDSDSNDSGDDLTIQ